MIGTHEPEIYRWLVEPVTAWPDAHNATWLAERMLKGLLVPGSCCVISANALRVTPAAPRHLGE